MTYYMNTYIHVVWRVWEDCVGGRGRWWVLYILLQL